MRRGFELMTFSLVSIGSIGVALLDLFGIMDKTWLHEDIPQLTLLCVGLALGSIALLRESARRDLDTGLRKAEELIVVQVEGAQLGIISALQGVKTKTFPDSASYWEYARKRIERAERSVNDLTWGKVPSGQTSTRARSEYESYRRAILKITEGKGRHRQVVYREIMSFMQGYRLGRARELLNDQHPNYLLRFFDMDHDRSPPLIQFFVVDGIEVMIGVTPSEASSDCSFVSCTSPALAATLNCFFEAAWRKAETLKDTNGPRLDKFREIEARFPQPHY